MKNKNIIITDADARAIVRVLRLFLKTCGFVNQNTATKGLMERIQKKIDYNENKQ